MSIEDVLWVSAYREGRNDSESATLIPEGWAERPGVRSVTANSRNVPLRKLYASGYNAGRADKLVSDAESHPAC